MTVRALGGLALLNVAYLVAGLSLLWGIRGLGTWATAARLAGLGYLLGVASLGVTWTVLVVVGVPFEGITIVLTTACLVALGALLGHRARRPLPEWAPVTFTRMAIVAAAGVALAGVFLEALFRAARLHGLYAFDGWAFWVPKGKALYYFGGLDEQVFTTLPGPTYPPIVPLLDAAAFHAMGSADTVTLHVQYWILAVGFAAAVAGLLASRVPPWLVWPPFLLFLVAPRATERLLTPQADFLVDYLFVVSAVLVVLWLDDGGRWHLVAIAVLLGGAVLTKREGALLAACLIVAALLATIRRRSVWPSLLAVAVAVAATGVSWRLWYRAHDIGGEAPSGAGLDAGLSRALDALELSFDVLFDDALWSVVPVVGVAAIALGLAWGARSEAVFLGSLLGLVFLGGAWITASYPELPFTADEAVNPIVRYTAAAVALCAAATPLLLHRVWERAEAEEP